ncbi:unnamed protein product [Candida verbasci]|uniref:PPM-type phosphatase domain-containing protein n=1 Tax=Candida verbasci TaxID=1227364 RepID=A0A9W4TT24_9ASCO|nr:unnamed protein product [Candida verbasci]
MIKQLKCIKCIKFNNSIQLRFLSNAVSFTAVERQPNLPLSTKNPSKSYKLKVPLLKSPSHLGHATSRVNRLYNEDKYSANVLNLKTDKYDKTIFNFNIFDGHGGDQCSNYLSDNLSQQIEDSNDLINNIDNQRDQLFKNYAQNIGGYWKRWYRHCEKHLENWCKNEINLENLNNINNDDIKLRLSLSFLNSDYKFFNKDEKSGSTCTSALIETIYSSPDKQFQPFFETYYFNRHTISKLTIAQVGDTKAILVDKNGIANSVTEDHHPSNPIEATRLRKYAANFFMTDSFGEERFIALANTRSFGDIDYKEVGVIAEPDIYQFIIGDSAEVKKHLTPDEIKKYTINGLGGDESFLILVSDGITNILTDQEIADIISSHFNMQGHTKANPQSCAHEVIKFVEYVGGDDNATCLVIRLNGWGKWPNIDRTGELRQARLDDFNPRNRGGG